MDRLAMIRKMVAERPDDPFRQYGLAMELSKQGETQEAGATFDKLMSEHPAYQAAYLMAGNHFAASGDKDKARATYEKGIEVARGSGDAHAEGELEAALGEL